MRDSEKAYLRAKLEADDRRDREITVLTAKVDRLTASHDRLVEVVAELRRLLLQRLDRESFLSEQDTKLAAALRRLGGELDAAEHGEDARRAFLETMTHLEAQKSGVNSRLRAMLGGISPR